jgi:hypothetical protein
MAETHVSRFIFMLVVVALGGCDASAPTSTSKEVTSATPETMERVAPLNNSATDFPASSEVQTDSNLIVVDPADLDTAHGPSLSAYPGKTIQITSIVTAIEITGRSNSILTIRSGSSLGASIFSAKEKEAWARIGPGQTVTLRSDHVDNWWQIVEGSKNPCPIISCASIAQEFEEAPLLAGDKYERRSFYLVGRVVEIDANQNAFFVLAKMEASPKVELRLAISKVSYPDFLKSLGVGQNISVLCAYDHDRIDKTLSKLELVAQPITVPFPVAGIEYLKSMPSLEARAKESAAKIRQEEPDLSVDLPALIKSQDDRFRGSQGGAERAKLSREGNAFEVSGFIRSFGLREGRPEIVLGTDPQEGGSIKIYMTESPWMRFAPGQWVTIRSRVRMRHLLRTFDDGVVMDSKEPSTPLREVTAAELVNSCRESNDAFLSWRDAYVKLSGQLRQRDTNSDIGEIQLDGESGFSVRVFLQEIEHARRKKLGSLPAGTSVKILGRVRDIDLAEKVLRVDSGWICDEAP